MEVNPAPPRPPENLSAELVGLQYGLASAKDLVQFSVMGATHPVKSLRDLVDPRLGLPAEEEKCLTCGGTTYENCTGHFGHVRLPEPIFHPNYVRLLQRILQKICLGCGTPKPKKMKIQIQETTASEENVKRRIKSRGLDTDFSMLEKEQPEIFVAADPIERFAGDGVILLSSDDEDHAPAAIPIDILKVVSQRSSVSFSEEAPAASPRDVTLRDLRDYMRKGKPQTAIDVIASNDKFKNTAKSFASQGSSKSYKGRPSAGLNVLYADNLKTAVPSRSGLCPYCSPGNPDYPPILVQLLPLKWKERYEVSQILQLEIQSSRAKDVMVAPDYWAFIDGSTHRYENSSKVPLRRVLLPSEAVKLLRRIPEKFIGKLGMNKRVARPEALIMACVPVPPNCTRTTDLKYVNNTTAVIFGTDRVTKTLQNLVTEIDRIQNTRSGKAMPRARRDESKILQVLTAEYLREKGAPKVVAGKEPTRKDLNGRITKQDGHRWTKEWVTEFILGKGGNYAARAVIVGDPYIGIEEIGVPSEISRKLTIPEKATRWNCSKLQEYVTRTQSLKDDCSNLGPGAMRIERNGECFQVWSGLKHEVQVVQIGDIVHRHIQDGDYVYANRPPSVHKHSLMALKVTVHDGPVLRINPLICPPYNADFDGDIFHVFVPQSMQARVELEQLMSVPQQIVSDHGGHPLLGLTQDTLLAAHLITSSKELLDKASMDQVSMWASKEPPEAAIVKSPKGGPFWTGEQVFGLMLPPEFSLELPDEDDVIIRGGEILNWQGNAKLLHKGRDGISGALCTQLGTKALVDYLNSAKGLLHAWLDIQGFSTGLTDFLVTHNLAFREKMMHSIFEDYFLKSMQESCFSVQMLDRVERPDNLKGEDDNKFERLTKEIGILEVAAQATFRSRAADAENIVLKYAEKNNSLLLMVRSGSKGSVGKLLLQIAGLGLQLYKGHHLLRHSSGTQRHPPTNLPLLDWWENHGFVRSSLVDGLNPFEMFNHIVADRTGILRKHVEVVQPGTLFKALMLFLRDLCVMYDGSVRSQCNQNIIQFCYGGAVGAVKKTTTWLNIPFGGEGEFFTWEEDDTRRWQLSVLAGEPVGILAATALAQPAYELMLDAPVINGPFKPRPLELVQETLYPRDEAGLKPTDRCVIIRLAKCSCSEPLCLERRALVVQAHLKRVLLKMVARSSCIEFWNMENFGVAGPRGIELRLGSPWLGHIGLSEDMMWQYQLSAEEIVQRLREKFRGTVKVSKSTPWGKMYFCSSNYCGRVNGPCLHFSPKLPPKMQNQADSDIYTENLLKLLERIRRIIIPVLLGSTIKGDERMESVKIVSEGSSCSIWHSETTHENLEEELVLEIVTVSTGSAKRGMAWNAVKQACLLVMDMVDWTRSMPYSIQEIRHTFGVEVAYEMVVRRLGLVLEKTAPHVHHVHVKLIADMMTFSGDANGFTISGYRDMNKSCGISAPFTEATFRQPMRNFSDAAARGSHDSLEGVMTSCVWGKEAPIGTGINIDLRWQLRKDQQEGNAKQGERIGDAHLLWRDLHDKCIPDKEVPPSPTHELPDLQNTWRDNNMDVDDIEFSPRREPVEDIIENDNWGNVGPNDTGGRNDNWDTTTSKDEWGEAAPKQTQDGENQSGERGWGDIQKPTENSAPTEDSKDAAAGWGETQNPTQIGEENGGQWNDWGKPAENCNDIQGGVKVVSFEGGERNNRGTDDAAQGGWGSVATDENAGGGGWDKVDKVDKIRVDESMRGSEEEGWGKSVNDKKNEDVEKFQSRSAAVTTKPITMSPAWGETIEPSRDDADPWSNLANPQTSTGAQGNMDSSNRFGKDTWNEGAKMKDPVQLDSQIGGSMRFGGCSSSGWNDIPAQKNESSAWDSIKEAPGSEEPYARSGGEISSELQQGSGSDRDWNSSKGTQRSGGGSGAERGRQRGTPGSGANVIPLGRQRQFGNSQPINPAPVVSRQRTQETSTSAWPDDSAGQSNWQQDDDVGNKSSSWGALQSLIPGTQERKSAGSDWDDLQGLSIEDQFAKRYTSSVSSPLEKDKATEMGDWNALIPDTTASDGWTSLAKTQDHDDVAANNWASSSSQKPYYSKTPETQSPANPELGRQELEPVIKEIDDIVKSMRRILFKYNKNGDRLDEEDDTAVQAVLKYHPSYLEKAGCGIAYIKVDRSPGFQENQCFWLVRLDGSDTDFSFHKCLKEKVSKEYPSFKDKYDVAYGRRGI